MNTDLPEGKTDILKIFLIDTLFSEQSHNMIYDSHSHSKLLHEFFHRSNLINLLMIFMPSRFDLRFVWRRGHDV